MGTKQLLKPYSGPLTPGQAAAGITAALSNAQSLLEDARVLAEHQRWARAAALAILSMEEAGKVHLLRLLAVAKTHDQLKRAWQDYRLHTKKNIFVRLPEYVKRGTAIADFRIEDFRSLLAPDAEHPFETEAVKQVALYTDCLGNAHWSVPSDVISAEMLPALLLAAETLIGAGHIGGMVSEAELAIFVKHLRPVLDADTDTMKKALLACYHEAAEARVLQGSVDAETMARFMLEPKPGNG